MITEEYIRFTHSFNNPGNSPIANEMHDIPAKF